MTIHQLEFSPLVSVFSTSWYAKIPGFSCLYSITIDRETGKVFSFDPSRTRTPHPSIDAAKAWCQADFEQRVKELIKYKLPEAIYPDTIPFPEL